MGGRSLALALVAVLLPLQAWADDEDVEDLESTLAPKDPRAARTWIAAGRELMAKGEALARRNKLDEAATQWANAATAFEKAIKWGADPNVYADLAAAEEKLGKLELAARHYRKLIFTSSGVRNDVLRRAKSEYDELLTRVGVVTLLVKPEGVAISLGGSEVGRSPLRESLILMPGQYKVSFTADGHKPKEIVVSVDEGSESERNIVLESINGPAPRAKEGPGGKEGQESQNGEVGPRLASTGSSKVPLYIGGGAALVFAGIGYVTGTIAVGRHSQFTDLESSTSARDDAQSTGKRFAMITDVALGSAAVATAFTAIWYFAKYRPAQAKHSSESASVARSKLLMAPWVQTDAGGFAVAGSF